MLRFKFISHFVLAGVVSVMLAACGGSDSSSSASSSSSSSSTPAPTYTVSGTVSGLTASGLVLQLNGAGNVTVTSGATSFAMTTALTSGQAYAVTISTPPAGLTCTLANASGTIGSANVTNVAITCVPSTYTVTTSISGLSASGLKLQLNANTGTSVASGTTTYTFPTTLLASQNYSVAIIGQPAGLTCTLANASGTVGSTNVTNVAITCITPQTYTVTTSITGLTASGLTLQLNANTSVPVASNATTYTFANTLLTSQNYGVAILAQPTGLTCTIANSAGTIGTTNITNVAITCITTPTYTVTANITGLSASGLVLQLNSTNNATITSGATSYTFPALPTSQSYSVSILTQPTGLTCTPGISTGAGSSTNVSVAISCAATATTYTVGGTITGLNASGLVLALNVNGGLANTISVASGATTFTFATPLNNAATYTVGVYTLNLSQFNQPTGQTCTVTSGSGTIASANKTNVVVTCVTNPNTTVSGTITGLTAAGLKLTLNGYTSTGALTQLEELTLASGASTFTFANTFTSVTYVTLRVSSQPTGLTCIIANPSGNVGNASLTTPQIECATRTTNSLVGTYKHSATNGVSANDSVFITFFNDGSFTFAANGDGTVAGADAEYGIYNWNQSTGAFTVALLAVDTKTNDGLNNDPCCTLTVSVNGSTLNLVEVEGAVTTTYTLTAATNVSGSLTGSWLLPNSGHGHDFVVFTGTGTYMWSFTGGLITANSTNSPFNYNGVENACYTATSTVISPTLTSCSVATGFAGINANGNPGFFLATGALNTGGLPTSYSISGDTMIWTYSNGNTQTLTRITN